MNPTATAVAHSKNSTNVRSWADRAAPLPLRAFFRAVGPAFPHLAGAVASRLFVTPPRPAVSPRVAGILARGERFSIWWRGGVLRAWRWGHGPTVLLVHGWGGYGAQFASFVPALEAAGYRAVVIDGPAHGESDGRRTNLLEFAEAVLHVGEEVGPLAGVVAHSFGGASTAIAMSRGLDPGRSSSLPPRILWWRRSASPPRCAFASPQGAPCSRASNGGWEWSSSPSAFLAWSPGSTYH